MKRSIEHMHSVGGAIKNAREANNMPLEQVAFETQIPIATLSKIENNKLASIDHPFFVKRYLTAIAFVVGLNTDLVLALYKRDFEDSETTTSERNASARSAQRKFVDTIGDTLKKKTKQIITIRNGAGILALALLAVGGYFGFSLIQNAFRNPNLTLTAPIEVSEGYKGTFKTFEDSIVLEGTVDEDSIVTINNEKITLSPEFTFKSDPIVLTEQKNQVVIEAENSLERSATITLTVHKKDRPVERLLATVLVQEGSAVVTVKPDGEQIFNGQIGNEDRPQFEAEQYIEVETPDFARVAVLIEGQEYQLEEALTIFRVSADGTAVVVE